MNVRLTNTENPKKRISNRRYAPRKCANPDCGIMFIPTNNKQIYCCDQHRVDRNNDKRKEFDGHDSEFLKGVKKNRKVLRKIYLSKHYRSTKKVTKDLLDYEEFDDSIYHDKLVKKSNNHDVLRCYDFELECTDVEEEEFIIREIPKKNK